MAKIMSKRVLVTLPDSIAEDLEVWAEGDGRAVANLASFIIESNIIEARNDGRIDEARKRVEAKKK